MGYESTGWYSRRTKRSWCFGLRIRDYSGDMIYLPLMNSSR